ncbi:MAG: DUF1854 domain-containing protein [Armatimonadetes bacterium]|nr:DUF1854 domain-containing protein [Armatimonadota bacterium]
MLSDEAPASSDLQILDPRKVRLERDDFQRLILYVGIEERYQPVRVVRALPLSQPDRWIAFQDDEGNEIGMLARVSDLEPHSRQHLEEELDLVYLKAKVQEIRNVASGHGMIHWDLVTDLGPRLVYVRDRSDVRPLPDGRIVLTDVHGAKYEIPPLDQLDERSRQRLEVEM